MEITLEKIELVKDRTGVTYAEAKAALEENDGSVVDAIIAIEETINSGEKSRGFGKKGEALFARIKEIVKKGNVSKIQVKKRWRDSSERSGERRSCRSGNSSDSRCCSNRGTGNCCKECAGRYL